MDVQKPFLKWVGGKTQILSKVVDTIPDIMENYHEIFLGGGSVLLAVLSLQKQGKLIINGDVCASDINSGLINLYKHIQSNPENLHAQLTRYYETYSSEETEAKKESYYYICREAFNKTDKETVHHSALFMFLNKTCFRGMYREGPDGFNVPFGHYKNVPKIITMDEMKNIQDLIKDVKFRCIDFIHSIRDAKHGDFIYLDPPYVPETKKSFVKYNADGFGAEDHKKLFVEMHNCGVKFAMSNSKTELVIENFKDCKIIDIKARRAINSKNPGSTTTEVLITN